ncbi:hypothetical protein [Methylobacterium nigriterrae]|uniref:hypothetical protein n=1 Tax=Methylobacterium nigriterrae TaxID=3127512 RepID=UPI003013804E
MTWSAAYELALTKRYIAEKERFQIAQLARIADQMRHGQDTAAAEQALRDIEVHLTLLRAQRTALGALQGY